MYISFSLISGCHGVGYRMLWNVPFMMIGCVGLEHALDVATTATKTPSALLQIVVYIDSYIFGGIHPLALLFYFCWCTYIGAYMYIIMMLRNE